MAPQEEHQAKTLREIFRRARGSYIQKQESFDTLRSQRPKANAITTKSPYPRVPLASTCHLNRKRPKGDNGSKGKPRCPHNIHHRRAKRRGIKKTTTGNSSFHPTTKFSTKHRNPTSSGHRPWKRRGKPTNEIDRPKQFDATYTEPARETYPNHHSCVVPSLDEIHRKRRRHLQRRSHRGIEMQPVQAC